MEIHRWNADLDGPFSEAALRKKFVSMGYRVSRFVYPPGTVFPAHTHHVDKLDGVVSGCFRITMGTESVTLEAGHWIAVPRGREHRAEVLGRQAVVSLDGVRDG